MMKDEQGFKEYLALLTEKYQVEISQAMSKMIWKVLAPFSDKASKSALDAVIVKGRFFKDLLPDLQEFLQGGKDEGRPILAWMKVDEAMRKYGSYRSIDFGDPAIHRVIENLGGWEYLGTLSEDEWKWKRKEFESSYKAVMNSDTGPERVIGIIERDNLGRHYLDWVPETVYLGERKKLALARQATEIREG